MMDEIDDRQQQAEAAGQIAVTPAECRRQRLYLILVLKLHDEFHLRTRNKIDVLVDEFLSSIMDEIGDRQPEGRRQRVELISVLKQHDAFHWHWRTRNKIDELVEQFLTKTKDDLHDMLCDINSVDDEDLYYRGLDSDRDTEAEVETALRFFPEVLSRRGGLFNIYPIQYLATNPSRSNVKAVPFISLLARLAIEFGFFEKEKRGGLLFEDESGDNILEFLVNDRINREHFDDAYLNLMIQLRQMDYFKKEDIQKYCLVRLLCRCRVIFEKIFRFLVEWDPASLIQIYEYNGYRWLPLHVAAKSASIIQGFWMVFEYGIRYYPKKKGISLLFKNSHYNRTPFQIACERFGYKEVIKVVEDILIHYSDTPINITEALIPAAIDEDTHLDCVYFLLRREPDVVMKLMPSSSILTSLKLESTNDNILIRSNHNNSNKKEDSNDGGSISDNGMHSVSNNDDLMAITNPKKRKERDDDQVS